MAEKACRSVSLAQQKKAIAEEIWLKYYNQVLFQKGLISERERNLMTNMIDSRTRKGLSR